MHMLSFNIGIGSSGLFWAIFDWPLGWFLLQRSGNPVQWCVLGHIPLGFSSFSMP